MLCSHIGKDFVWNVNYLSEENLLNEVAGSICIGLILWRVIADSSRKCTVPFSNETRVMPLKFVSLCYPTNGPRMALSLIGLTSLSEYCFHWLCEGLVANFLEVELGSFTTKCREMGQVRLCCVTPIGRDKNVSDICLASFWPILTLKNQFE